MPPPACDQTNTAKNMINYVFSDGYIYSDWLVMYLPTYILTCNKYNLLLNSVCGFKLRLKCKKGFKSRD